MSVEEQPDDLHGRRLGPEGEIELKRLLAYGSSCAIWLGRDEEAKRDVAVKLLRPQLLGDQRARTRFIHEWRRFGRIRHPNIIRVYRLGRHRDQLYLVLEYVQGRTLTQLLRRDGSFDVLRALEITRDVAAALHEAHERQVIHRDLKPDNIMIRSADGAVKVLDFGIAKDLNSQTGVTQVGMFVGTPAYSAPEQITGKELDARTDVFALGVLLYELIVGKVSFDGRRSTDVMKLTLKEQRVPVDRLYDLVTRPVADLIHRMSRRNPERRPSSMMEVSIETTRIMDVLTTRLPDEDRTGVHAVLRDIFEGQEG